MKGRIGKKRYVKLTKKSWISSCIEYLKIYGRIPGLKQAVGKRFSAAIMQCFKYVDEIASGQVETLEVQKSVFRELSECVC